jgi:RimJ/RimL family protein N-acetyltransferase
MKLYRTGPETRRLTHRAFTLDDAEVFYSLNSNPEVMRLTGEPPLPSLEAARDAIAGYPDFDEVGYGRWACVLKETGTVIGFCGLKYLADLDAVDVGYRFLTPYWGRGFATEACRASLEFGFSTLGLQEIIGLVFTQNIASIRVLEKMGMRLVSEFEFDGMPARRYALNRRMRIDRS